MFIHTIYKAVKQRLSTTGVPIFFYIGQYQPGKGNTSYLVPAIYIEMPKETPLVSTKRIMKSKGVPVKIHLITYAPFKNEYSAAQELAIQQHEEKLREIDLLLNGWAAKDGAVNLTELLIARDSSLMKYQGMTLISEIEYTTDMYSTHLL